VVMGIALRGCRHPPRRIMSSVRIQASLPKADHQRVNDDSAILGVSSLVVRSQPFAAFPPIFARTSRY
jgi:hypothetical protein